MGRSLLSVILCAFFMATSITTPAQADSDNYTRREIRGARFGEGERKDLLENAYRISEKINRSIFGQERAAQIIEDRIVQYLEGFGTRTKDPVALHMIGLSGIGKSAILDELERSKLPVVRFDVQNFSSTSDNFEREVRYSIHKYVNEKKPVILLVEELDKLPEFEGGRSDGKEKSNGVIGTINQILTEGTVGPGSSAIDASNIFVMTTMNFSPEEIEEFALDVLAEEKSSYFDLTVEDFEAFDRWVQENPSSRYKILSRMFRPNTVGRMAPNTIILKPLNWEDYNKITEGIINSAIKRATTGENAERRLNFEYTDELLKFIARNTTFAPSGARETVYRADALIEQLITYGMKAELEDDKSLTRPRDIVLHYDEESDRVYIQITPKWKYRGDWKLGDPVQLSVQYSEDLRQFERPKQVTNRAPKLPTPKREERERPVTQKETRESRFPKSSANAKGLAKHINSTLIGQESFASYMEQQMNAYMSRKGPSRKAPSSVVLSGFPGIGKTEMARLTAEYLKLPVIRINMQEYASDSEGVVAKFIERLETELQSVYVEHGPDAKFMVLIEEVDKVYEIDQKGSVVNRPVMAIFKDLMNDGVAAFTSASGSRKVEVDLRQAFLFTTMNFSTDRFGFEADPRLTSVDDVYRAWKKLDGTLADKKSILGSMFLPDTVSRIMSKYHILPPLKTPHYRTLIEQQALPVVTERFFDEHQRDIGQVKLVLTPAYKKYLFNETVIPSEGPRNTVEGSRRRIFADMEATINGIKRSSPLAASPIVVTLDYKPAKHEVVGTVAQQSQPKRTKLETYRNEVALNFPPIKVRGRIAGERLKTALHEFGHALTAVTLGIRIEQVQVVSPKVGTGGYVKFSQESASQMAKHMMARIYTLLGSRALERIFLSDDPYQPSSVMDISSGPSMDIKMATMDLFNMIYELGFDPTGGTMDRLGVIGGTPYANFSSLPAETVQLLGKILRDMENHIVKDLLEDHPQEWFQEKIVKLAREGGMDEKEFFELIERKHPGDQPGTLSQGSKLTEKFKDAVIKGKAEFKRSSQQKFGRSRRSATQALDSYTEVFLESVAKHLHGQKDSCGSILEE